MLHSTVAARCKAVVNFDRADQARADLDAQMLRGEWPLLAPLFLRAQEVIARLDDARRLLGVRP